MERRTRCDATLPSTLWRFSLDNTVDVYNSLHHSAVNESPNFLWSGKRRSINDFRMWGCHLEALKGGKLTNSEDRTESGYYLGTTVTRSVIRYWNPSKPKQIGYCTTARFNERSTIAPNGSLSYGSMISQSMPKPASFETLIVNNKNHPILERPIHLIRWTLPPSGELLGITIKYCPYFNCPYISKFIADSSYYLTAPVNLCHNVWILSVENNDRITPNQVVNDLTSHQQQDLCITIKLVVSKRESTPTRTLLEQYWDTFTQITSCPREDIHDTTSPITTSSSSSNNTSSSSSNNTSSSSSNNTSSSSSNNTSNSSSNNILPSEQKLADNNPVHTTVQSTTKYNTQSPVLDYNITNKPIPIISPVPDPLSVLPPLSKLPPAMSPIKYSSPRKLYLAPANQSHTSIASPIIPRVNTDDVITAHVTNITSNNSDPTESITWA